MKDTVILIPVYDPNENIMKTFIKELEKEFTNIVFVNDGCSSNHDKFMNNLSKKYPVIKHNINLGKGRGLKNGINYILNEYPNLKCIVTADCDGQHSVKDIKRCMEVCLKNQDSLVLGVRDFDNPNVPFKSKYGNKITRNILYVLTGIKISDTQTGLRAMSLDVAKELVDVQGERYEYETNVLIATKEKNITIKEVIIDTIYINNNETSHFNPVKDSLRIYKLFTSFLVVLLFSYILENYVFAITSNILALSLLLGKLVSSSIILLFNKNINVYYTVINYILLVLILSNVPKYIFVFKILLDFIMFVASIFIINFKTKKVSI